jgi:hypothetical protein
VDAALARYQEVEDQVAWLDTAANGGRSIAPYSAAGVDASVWQLRGLLCGSFDDWTRRREERLAQLEHDRQREELERPGRERRAQEAAAQADRVVFKGMTPIEKGGKPTRRSAFGFVVDEDAREES